MKKQIPYLIDLPQDDWGKNLKSNETYESTASSRIHAFSRIVVGRGGQSNRHLVDKYRDDIVERGMYVREKFPINEKKQEIGKQQNFLTDFFYEGDL